MPSTTITMKIAFTTEMVVRVPSDSALPATCIPSEQATSPMIIAIVASANLLGFLMEENGRWAVPQGIDLSSHSERLSNLRTAAMASKDFSAVDALKSALLAAGVEVRAEGDLLSVPGTVPATEADFGHEFLDMIVAAKIVDGEDE